jgi:uncharacterized membrane protein YkvA (DUF1232 family)|tara:strand:+ start:470 stop:742 length:273 start_codon:yes stop_codon:yes gene_type:complete
MTDKRVPFVIRMAIPLALIYVVSPIDFLPDLIPFAGRIDDLVALAIGLMVLLKLAPKKVVNEYKEPKKTVIDGEFREKDDKKSDKKPESK